MDTMEGDPGASLFSVGFAARLDAFDQLLQKAARHSPRFDSLLRHCNLNGRGLLLALVALLLLLVLPPITERILRRAGHCKPNFRGETIPQSVGIALVLYAVLLLCLTAYFVPAAAFSATTWLLAIGGFGGLGLLDDLRGDRTASGLRGHFRAAFKEKKITTGFIKAIGGLALALLIALRVSSENRVSALPAAAITALSANAVNLLDLRPGRAGAVFLALSLPLLHFALQTGGTAVGIPLLLFVAIPAARLYPKDAAAKWMLGDAGSNPLGAALALAFLELNPSPATQIVVLLALAALHLLAERASLTKIIEKNPLLRFLDSLTGVRKTPSKNAIKGRD